MRHSIQQALDLLGVRGDSDPATVAHAYRRLARLHHPDVSTAPDAPERFAALTTAYRLAVDHARKHQPDSAQPGQPEAQSDRTTSRSDEQRPIRFQDVPFGFYGGDLARPWVRTHATRRSPIVAGPVQVEPPRPDGSGPKGGG